MAKITIPTRFIYVDPGYRTKYLQHARTGKMMGRQGKEKGKLPPSVVARTDTTQAATKVRRVKPYRESGGEIFGRIGGITVRGSNRARGTTRTLR